MALAECLGEASPGEFLGILVASKQTTKTLPPKEGRDILCFASTDHQLQKEVQKAMDGAGYAMDVI